jgi:hypothetical protein
VTGQRLIRSGRRVTTALHRPTTSVLRCSWWSPQAVMRAVACLSFIFINLLGDHLTTDHLISSQSVTESCHNLTRGPPRPRKYLKTYQPLYCASPPQLTLIF